MRVAFLAALLDIVPPIQAQILDTFNPNANQSVYAMAVQPDGKILLGGLFWTLGGQSRNYIGRLNTDGTLDAAFNPGADYDVLTLCLQLDGKILVAGRFTTLTGQARSNIGRLTSNGALDVSFNPAANSAVYCMAEQGDGKIMIGGQFTTVGGSPRARIARLNSDGSLDITFNPGADAQVFTLALQPDGRILVGGLFSTLGGQTRNRIGRLNSDGTLDTGFDAGANEHVDALAIQADGKILVGGFFNTIGGHAQTNIARLHPDGTVDTTFNPGANSAVGSLCLQTDGKILVGGFFTTLCGETRDLLGRLNADGTLDHTFNLTTNYGAGLNALTVQPDGKILIGGSFFSLGAQPRYNIGRVVNTALSTESLAFDGAKITWLRGGASPEAGRTIFDASTNGADWFSVGQGERVSGGWQRTGVNLPTNANIRARGFVAGGLYNGSSWFMETIVGPPFIMSQPVSRTNNAGTAASFTVTITGFAPLSYQWLKDGVNLGDFGKVSGTQSPTLMVSNVFGVDAGHYSVIISNAYGSVTSHLVTLQVENDPFIRSQPTSRTNDAGASVTFIVVADGTSPLNYQWRKDGMNLGDGENLLGTLTPTLTLSNVVRADEGGYSVVISNAFGSVTSLVATLSVERDPSIIGQPVSPAASLGQTVVLSVTAAGTPPLSYQWRKGEAVVDGATNTSVTLTNIQWGDDGTRYDVLVSNMFGVVTSDAAILTISAALPDSFNPGANGAVYSLAAHADGRILVGGNFTTLAGGNCTNLGRINSDGTLDTTFNPAASGPVYSVAVQPDGRILVGGNFTSLAGQARNYIGRLNAGGALDTPFNPKVNNYVSSLVVQPDGSIVVGGVFQTLGGQARNRIGRLYADGTLDTALALGANNQVYSVAPQADGKVLVGGRFTFLGGQPRSRIGRFNADGTLDTTFNPGSSGFVYSIAVQADEKILVGGSFSGGLRRLNSDGTSDTNFNPGANGNVFSLAAQADGKILVGGNFTEVSGQIRHRIARLNTNGTLDPIFNPGANDEVYSVGLQADGKILVGGNFTALGGQTRNHAGRLSNPEPAIQSLTFDTSSITWLRSGSSPEVWRTTFEYSTNRVDWIALGSGTRIDGGWERTGILLMTNAIVRTRGFGAGGYLNGSGWFVQSWGGVPPPRLSAISFGTDGFRFTFESVPGMTYMIEQRNSFTGGDWTILEQRSASMILESVLDPSAVTNTRFYRVRSAPRP